MLRFAFERPFIAIDREQHRHTLMIYLQDLRLPNIYGWRRQDFDLVLPQAGQSRGARFLWRQQSSAVSKELRETAQCDYLPRIFLAFPYIILPLRVAASIFTGNPVFLAQNRSFPVRYCVTSLLHTKRKRSNLESPTHKKRIRRKRLPSPTPTTTPQPWPPTAITPSPTRALLLSLL
jgi:hypothetical protein